MGKHGILILVPKYVFVSLNWVSITWPRSMETHTRFQTLPIQSQQSLTREGLHKLHLSVAAQLQLISLVWEVLPFANLLHLRAMS